MGLDHRPWTMTTGILLESNGSTCTGRIFLTFCRPQQADRGRIMVFKLRLVEEIGQWRAQIGFRAASAIGNLDRLPVKRVVELQHEVGRQTRSLNEGHGIRAE